jgi:AcrR family transcriptional regulator
VAQRRKRLLDVESILDAALTCIDEHGRLTMADLAARLGASASSIYHHVRGRPEIIELIRERVVAGVEIPALDDTDWGEQVAAWMRSYRRSLAEHPKLVLLLTEQTMTAGAVLLGYDRVAALLGSAGFPAGQIMLWVSVLDSYALGAALDLAAPDEVWRTDGQTPALRDALHAAPQGRARADAAFELGLEALLVGMRCRLADASG